MEEEDKPEKYKQIENLELSNTGQAINPATTSTASQQEVDIKKKKGCHFPTAYTILLIIEIFVFILTYIIPKGQFYKIEYSSDKNTFIITTQNNTIIEKTAEQKVLDDYNIKIPIESFKKGYIKKPISIPNTYERIESESTNFFYLFLYPILGLIDSSDISVFLFVLGGILNILIEMEALSSGLAALARITKGREFLLIVLVFIIICICGSIFGLLEEILAFYPILMPVFLKNNVDGMLGAAPIYLGSMIGNMFSTINAFTVVLGSYSAGIPFINGIVFRGVCFVLGIIVTLIYLYFYYSKVQKDEKNSVVYEIKKDIIDKCLKKENEGNKKNENEKVNENSEEMLLLDKDKENENEKKDKEAFGTKQKIALIIFTIGFGIMIYGVMALDWWFEHMAAVFLVFSIILLFLLGKGEYKGIDVFVKGAGDFVGVAMIVGIARGINITLEEGKISDTILDSLTKALSGFHKIIFAVLMLIIFMILGIFISSSTGLAILAMPIFAPLGDEVNCDRKVIVNTYMFGQYFSGIVTPTGLVLIALQMVGIPYNYWIKFIWPYLIIMFIFLVILIIFDVIIES